MNRPMRSRKSAQEHERHRGQALVESCLAVALISLLIFGVLQVTRLYAAREVLLHAATAAARSRSVGFNDFMVFKVYRTASIPNAGLMTSPGFTPYGNPTRWRTQSPGRLWDAVVRRSNQPASAQLEVERSRIPLYLSAVQRGDLQSILDYENWEQIQLIGLVESADQTLTAVMRQRVPLTMPFRATFYSSDSVRQQAQSRMENHYPLFLE